MAVTEICFAGVLKFLSITQFGEKNILHGKMFVHFCIYLEQISLNVYQSRNISNVSCREILCQTHFSIKQVQASTPELLQYTCVFTLVFS